MWGQYVQCPDCGVSVLSQLVHQHVCIDSAIIDKQVKDLSSDIEKFPDIASRWVNQRTHFYRYLSKTGRV